MTAIFPTGETETDRVQREQELETPVALAEVAAPDVPFAFASLRAELAAREREDSFAGEVAAAAEGMKLPATLGDALARLREITASRPADKSGQKAKAIQSEKLRAHIHALSQGPTAPPINYSAFLKREPSPEAVARIRSLYPNAKKS
jgi:hypothetical protein